ncbi:MAG TPA: proton-conducting transporter membrane subunit [Kofleriaceae bacterium]
MTACLVAVAVLILSAAAALVARGRAASAASAIGALVAAGCALPGAIQSLAGARPEELAVSWAAPIGELRFGLDPLSAFFVIPLVVLGAAGAIYGAFYLDDERDARWLGVPACFYNLLVAAMLAVLLARDAIGLLIAWEVMTLASYLLVVHDHAQPDVQRAGWIYLIASHLGIACVLCAFVLLGNDGFAFAKIAGGATSGATAVVASVLALVGFGVKAGVVPLHVWLPEAHAAAPSHVSALMSGVMIKLGLYGILRTIVLVGPTLPWGPILLGLGVAGALVGISLAIYQRDLKKALAYSSVENIGIALAGLGVGQWAAREGHPDIAVLGLCGGLFHVWNHAVMKGLMFFCAGSVVHATGTRDLEQMGGLAKRMPLTGALMILGSVAIAALPPLNGFASEWLIYLGLARGGVGAAAGSGLLLLAAIAAIATVGVLGALSFVRMIGVGLLGQPRSEAAARAHESHRGLVAPMVALAAATVALPFLLPLLAKALEPVLAEVVGTHLDTGVATDALAPIATLSATLWLGGIAVFAAVRRSLRRRREAETWGCGYVAPTARMQYTGASFAEGIHRLLPRVLRAKIAAPQTTELFPATGELRADRQDPFTRAAYEPLLDRGARRFGQLRWVQQGVIHLYILYVVVAAVVVTAIVSIRDYLVLP